MYIDKKIIRPRVKLVIMEQLHISGDTFNRLISNNWDDLGADDLDFAEIIMGIEEEFGIEIDDKVSEEMFTPKQLINYLELLANVGEKTTKKTRVFGRFCKNTDARGIYTVTAHKWGERCEHSYLVGVYIDKGKAEEAAEEESLRRGRAYDCEILSWEPYNKGDLELHPRYVKEL